MEDVDKSGGPAFPFTIKKINPVYSSDIHYFGLTMRDCFAAAALKQMLPWNFEANITNMQVYANNIAITAYKIADAMLLERTKP